MTKPQRRIGTGKNAGLTCKGRATSQRAEFALCREGSDEALWTHEAEFVDKRAVWNWSAELPPGEADEAVLLVRAMVDEKPHMIDTFLVYRDELAIQARDEEQEPAADASFRVTIETPEGGVAARLLRRTDDEGKAVIRNLPYGTASVKWLSPWRLADPRKPWDAGKEEGREREVTLTRVFSARFHQASAPLGNLRPLEECADVKVRKAERKQWVNYAATPDGDSHFGHTLTLELAPLDAIDGTNPAENDVQGAPGDALWVRAVFGEKNSKRSCPEPGLVGAEVVDAPNRTWTKRLELGPDRRATCVVELGGAGGDEVELSVSARQDWEDPDHTLKVVTWRKLECEVRYFAESTAIAQAYEGKTDLADEVKASVKKALEPAFLELSCLGVSSVSAAAHQVARLAPDQHPGPTRCLVERRHKASLASIFVGARKRGPMFLFADLVGDVSEFPGAGGPCTPRKTTLTEPVSGWLATDGRLVLQRHPHDGKSALSARWALNGEVGIFGRGSPDEVDSNDRVEEALLHLDANDPTRFKLELPRRDGHPDDPGHHVGSQAKVDVLYKLVVLDPSTGYKKAAYHALEWSDDPARLAMALLHEIGHALHHAVVGRADASDPAHPHTYVGRGHEGSHCSSGLSASQREQADYAQELGQKDVHGTCIMWGELPRKRVNDAFCEHCLRFLKEDSWVVDEQGSFALQQRREP